MQFLRRLYSSAITVSSFVTNVGKVQPKNFVCSSYPSIRTLQCFHHNVNRFKGEYFGSLKP